MTGSGIFRDMRCFVLICPIQSVKLIIHNKEEVHILFEFYIKHIEKQLLYLKLSSDLSNLMNLDQLQTPELAKDWNRQTVLMTSDIRLKRCARKGSDYSI